MRQGLQYVGSWRWYSRVLTRQVRRGSPNLLSNGSQRSVKRIIRTLFLIHSLAKTPSYLQPTASTTQRAASSAPSKRTPHPTSTRHVPAQSNAPLPPPKDVRLTSGDDSLSKGELKSSMPKSRVVSRGEAVACTDLLLRCRLSFQTGAPAVRPPHSLHAENRLVQPEPHHDTLQVAAQVQSWLFMQSNLQDNLSVVQKGARVHCHVTLPGLPIADFPRTPIMLLQK